VTPNWQLAVLTLDSLKIKDKNTDKHVLLDAFATCTVKLAHLGQAFCFVAAGCTKYAKI